MFTSLATRAVDGAPWPAMREGRNPVTCNTLRHRRAPSPATVHIKRSAATPIPAKTFPRDSSAGGSEGLTMNARNGGASCAVELN